MYDMNDYDYSSDEERSDLDDEILAELEENRKLNVITNFKTFISKEPDFYGINYISGYNLLQILEKNKTKNKLKTHVSLEVLDFFDDLYIELFGYSNTTDFYTSKIADIKKCIYI
jgi:hypothetical protein